MSDSSNTNSGIGVFGLLGVVFVTLKLIGIDPVASWSWWWVTAPFWGGLALVLSVVAVIFLGAMILLAIERMRQ